MPAAFSLQDCGCYADGTFGSDYVCQKAISLAIPFCSKDQSKVLQDRKTDILTRSDLALLVLQDHTPEGLAWVFLEGDLLLLKESEIA